MLMPIDPDIAITVPTAKQLDELERATQFIQATLSPPLPQQAVGS
jgi:hypothetical protein